jgi:hypothetical protein
MSLWTAVLTDKYYKPLGELTQMTGFQYSRGLNKLATCGFTVRLDNEFVDALAACEGYLKLYRQNGLRYFGPLVTAEQQADASTKSLAVTSADVGWILSHRLAGKSTTGTIFAAPTDLAQIAKTLIDTTNAEWETGLSTSVGTLSAGSGRTYTAGPYRNILEIVQELATALDGYEWRVVPIDNWGDGVQTNIKIGYLEATPLIGSYKPLAVFEYGPNTRSNILTYNFSRTRDQQANRVFHALSDFSDPHFQNNTAAQSNWGLMEDILSLPDVTDSSMRDGIIGEHVAVRGNPRDIVRITPHIDPGPNGIIPHPFEDYDIGDTITARIVVNGEIRFAGLLRVYGINVTVDDATGFERVELVTEDDS